MEYEKNIVIDDKFKATLAITLTKEVVRKEYDALLKKYSKEIAMPGFRRGKVPPSVLENRYSLAIKDELLSNIIEEISKDVFSTLPKEQLPLYCSQPTLTEEVKIDLDSELSFTLTYDVKPKVEIKKWEGFEIKVPEVSVTDEDVEEDIKAIQERNALIQAKSEDGIVEKGDVVTISYVCEEEGSSPNKRDDYVFTVGSGENYYNFDDDILAMKKGEVKKIVKTYPDDYENENLKGTTKNINVTIKAIKQKILPNLDDEFAQDIDESYKTFEDFKNGTKKKIEDVLNNIIYERKKSLILEKLVEANPVFIPESMILDEISRYYSNIASQYGISQREFLNSLKGKENEYIQSARPEATKRLQEIIILDALRKQHNIESNEADIDSYIKEYAEERALPFDEVKQMVEKPENKEDISYKIAEKKLFDFLLAKSTFEKGDKLSLKEFLNQ